MGSSWHSRPPTHPASHACTRRPQVKDYFTALVNRRNSITGVKYRDDPVIFR